MGISFNFGHKAGFLESLDYTTLGTAILVCGIGYCIIKTTPVILKNSLGEVNYHSFFGLNSIEQKVEGLNNRIDGINNANIGKFINTDAKINNGILSIDNINSRLTTTHEMSTSSILNLEVKMKAVNARIDKLIIDDTSLTRFNPSNINDINMINGIVSGTNEQGGSVSQIVSEANNKIGALQDSFTGLASSTENLNTVSNILNNNLGNTLMNGSCNNYEAYAAKASRIAAEMPLSEHCGLIVSKGIEFCAARPGSIFGFAMCLTVPSFTLIMLKLLEKKKTWW